MARISPTHLVFLAITVAVTAYITQSAISAAARVNNLVIVVPVAIAIVALVFFLLLRAPRDEIEDDSPAGRVAQRKATYGDLTLLALFAIFCMALVAVGFDVATFLFVWIGIVLGGERRWWIPPVYAAAFTLLLVYGLGALFPFPMPMLVLP